MKSNTSKRRGPSLELFEETLPWRARIYLLAIILTGLPILLYSLYYCFTRANPNWVLLAGLTGLAACFPIQVLSFSRGKIWISLSDVFVFLTIFAFGPQVAAVVAATEALAFNLRMRKLIPTPGRLLFNVAQIVIVAFAGGHFYYLLGPVSAENPIELLMVAFASGLYYYSLSSTLVARAVTLTNSRPFFTVWRESLHQMHITFSSALVSVLIFLYVS